MNITTNKVTFQIDIYFNGSDVDMVYKEDMAAGVQTSVPSILVDGSQIPIDRSKLPKTPLSGTVAFALGWLGGFVDRRQMCLTTYYYGGDRPLDDQYKDTPTELQQLGLEVEDTYDLMMGQCHLTCSCMYNDFSPEKVAEATTIVENIFNRFIQYHG